MAAARGENMPQLILFSEQKKQEEENQGKNVFTTPLLNVLRFFTCRVWDIIRQLCLFYKKYDV